MPTSEPPVAPRFRASPLDRLTEPGELTARVVSPEGEPRLLGYDVQADLALHYGFPDVVGLLLAGRLLEPDRARALEIALVFLSPVTVAEGPGHAAVLSRVCAVPFRSTVGLAAVTLAEEGAAVIAEHADWLAWLQAPVEERGSAPPEFLSAAEADRSSLGRLRSALERVPFELPVLELGPKPVAALLAVLAACGLGAEAMTTAWVLARLPAAAAEAAARPLLRLADYPINLPPVVPADDPEVP